MEETVWDKIPLYPSLKNVQKQDFWKPNETQYKLLQDVSRAHIESFNFITRLGLYKAIENIPPVEYELPNGDRVKLEIKDASIGYPNICGANNLHAVSLQLYPSECRASGITYKSKLEVSLQWSKNGIVQDVITKNIGEIPIMVKSNVCNLSKLTPKQLIEKGEEEEEFGGYFIINGIEKIMRLLLVQRRNYVSIEYLPFTNIVFMTRKLFATAKGECAVESADSAMNQEALLPGHIYLAVLKEKIELWLQIIRKNMEKKAKAKGAAFEINITIMNNCVSTSMDLSRPMEYLLATGNVNARSLLGLPQITGLSVVAEKLNYWRYLSHFRSIHRGAIFTEMRTTTVRKLLPESWAIMNNCVSTSMDLSRPMEYLLATGNVNARSLLGLPQITGLSVVAEKLNYWRYLSHFRSIHRGAIFTEMRTTTVRKLLPESWGFLCPVNTPDGAPCGLLNHLTAFCEVKTIMNNCVSTSMDLSRPMEYLLATGNVNARSLLGLPQITGLSVVAEKLNYWRYLSHFRSIHRGAIFTEMRTTTVRKLLPESWGFLCPVNTPDGAPCGLLNHLTAFCEIVNVQPPVGHLPKLLTCLGMIPYDGIIPTTAKFYYIIFLDGKVIGWVSAEKASDLVNKLRYLKTLQKEMVSNCLEIGFVPKTAKLAQYPGIFLFSTPSRFVRPVHNLSVNSTEMVGTFEQVYLDICVIPEEAIEGITTHQEIREISILSILANMIPFSDFNQSPRNMYQCQMGKQTMGTPCYAYKYRSDNKLYRIQTPHTPLVRPTMYDHYHMDNYPTGTNAIVAVISYTGYDMEDAIVLNKSSLERGFKYGGIYKSVFVDLRDLAGDRSNQTSYMFGKKYFVTELEHKLDIELKNKIDEDGLPFIGTRLDYESPMCSYIDLSSNEVRVIKYKSTESAYVFDVKVIGSENGVDILQKICITLWIPRPPIIGDKFASRHGQKGVCSQKWPIENMPFTESGMVPDIIFNPHGFPSRMTIGMMIESMAGKSASLHGIVHDATAFKFSESYPASEYFGELLQKAGYNYFGTERMYSGIDGRELEADIFFGVVYYQRLRHMVADKFQVRTTGPIDILTHQPVKGRKRAGGIRFGEMERDSLLAHGTSFLLHDRLFNCSDKSMAYACRQCGSLLSPLFEKPVTDENLPFSKEKVPSWKCITCNTDDTVDIVSIPYVFRYLVTELAAINIKVKLDIR
ncbi:DNA-directed RNA polymerase I subunit RPA2-like [Centruroides sculpturatus]|uniref:DNA-directed RNA polymerase I subunit RPA2-like n=1 Tax=Centruroides sculpturatus TaxID=218467 RepID=UPI000C6D01E6|nr:DNA-directed RNA polymerase I subunit RPA2-like [Centruroides sculpturatus]